MWPTHYIPYLARLDGKPPPRSYLTTPPYPVEVTETTLTASGKPVAVTPGIGSEDEIESSGMFMGGVIDDILVGFDGGFDEIESSGKFISAILNDILVAFNAGHDEIESTGKFISGVLYEVPVVSYLNWPLGYATEDLIGTGTFVSGELV